MIEGPVTADMLGRSTFGRMMIIAALALGVLEMHGLSAVGAAADPQHRSARFDTAAFVAVDAGHVPHDAGAHAIAHLSEGCIWLLVAGLSAAGLALAMRTGIAHRALLAPPMPHAPPHFPAGRSPPQVWSHLDLAVLLS